MKKEELFEILGGIDEAEVEKAGQYAAKKQAVRIRWGILAACAAVILLAVFGIPALRNARKGSGGVLIVKAAYPEGVAAGMDAQEFAESEEHWNWWKGYRDKVGQTAALYNDMEEYDRAVMKEILTGDDNTVCSPLNTYIALAMLAEASDGNTQAQVLHLLDVPDLATLRAKVSAMWENNCVDTPILTSRLSNSLWLSKTMKYNEDTLNCLAETYYASSFRGTPGSDEMNEALRSWTDENTGGLLKEYTKDMRVNKDLVMDIVSTIYYKAEWLNSFSPELTAAETFHGTKGDTEVRMMHLTDMAEVYRTDKFTALSMNLYDSGAMYFYLPQEGTDVESLLSDPDLFKAAVFDENDPNRSVPMVNISIPKFRVSAKTDLKDVLARLGVTDALDPMLSDFSPLTSDRDDIYLAKADHAAMVEIDEYGVTGAAYTELELDGAGAALEIMDFTLDRPFLFLLTGKDGSVLFSGIVRNID
ncbi:MAG: serpin family protein [Lachnospiraceae bacterium]|nr:serpin family protein [Lachnospiraceae bacterium]